MVLSDLLTSEDGNAMSRSFHANDGTWSYIRHYYRYQRHRLSVHLEHLALVDARGSGPLNEAMQLRHIQWQPQEIIEEISPYYEQNRVATLRRQSFTAECAFVNGKDRSKGLLPALNFIIEAKSLDRNERVARLQCGHTQ
jgi:hypothetical protein